MASSEVLTKEGDRQEQIAEQVTAFLDSITKSVYKGLESGELKTIQGGEAVSSIDDILGTRSMTMDGKVSTIS